MGAVAAARVHVPCGIELNPVWNPGVGVSENTSIQKFLGIWVDVELVTGM